MFVTFGEVQSRVRGGIGALASLEILDNLLDERHAGQETNLQSILLADTVFKWGNKIEQDLGLGVEILNRPHAFIRVSVHKDCLQEWPVVEGVVL